MAALNSHLYTRSMFGEQAASRRRSAPSFGFGSSTRNQAAKVFLSSDHAKLSTPGFSPGPSAYTLKAAVGTQADGRKASSPQWVFGTNDRFSFGKRSDQNPGGRRAPAALPAPRPAQHAWRLRMVCMPSRRSARLFAMVHELTCVLGPSPHPPRRRDAQCRAWCIRHAAGRGVAGEQQQADGAHVRVRVRWARARRQSLRF